MRTAEEEHQFLLERSTAIGGSDVQHLLSLPPYGCKRRLWYDKKGVKADFPFLGNRHTRRGQLIEPLAIAEFLAGENYSGEGLKWTVQEHRRHAGAHVDHLIWRPSAADDPTIIAGELYNPTQEHGKDQMIFQLGRKHAGVLEVKVPSSRNYYTLCAKGPNEATRLQLQWGIIMAQVGWGRILLFNADAWRYRSFGPFPHDPGLAEDLLSIADNFWASLDSDRPRWERLDPQSRQCQDCPWRKTCQGITRESPVNLEYLDEPTEMPEEDESFFDLVAAAVAATQVVKDAEEAKKAARSAIVARLGGRPRKLRCSAGTVSYFEVVTPPSAPKPKPERSHMTLLVRPAKSEPLDGADYDEIETD